MDLDLTPRKYTKKSTPRRRRPSRLLKNWRNPFQLAIVGVAVIAFLGTTLVDRITDRRVYTVQIKRAEILAAQINTLNAKACELHAELMQVRSGVILKQKSEAEESLEIRLVELALQTDRCMQQINDCFDALSPRYRNKYAVWQWFVDVTRGTLDAALVRGDYEQARLWFNASAVNYYMAEMRSRIEGKGTLEIAADDSIEMVLVIPLKSDGPRLAPCDPLAKSNELPLILPEVEPGSYVIWATSSEGTFLPFPLFMEYGEHKRIELRAPSSLPQGMVYIPEGPFYAGGADSPLYRRHRAALAGYLIRQKEVTVEEYLEFWTGLTLPEEQEAFRGWITLGGEHRPAWDESGNLLDPRLKRDYPVVGISAEAASAYCNWLGQRLGQNVRLPSALEWEKAARGVDGRTYPWGYGYDPEGNFALVRDNTKGREQYSLWAPPGSFKRDVSVYNVFDMAGNVREMTSSPLPDTTSLQVKGGSALTSSEFMRCSNLSVSENGSDDVGFRYVMLLGGEEP